MPTDFIPARDADLVAWGQNFSALISAGPVPLGLTAAQASAFAALNTAYAAAYTTATEPSTRTRGTVASKREARRLLVDNARLLARLIQAEPTVTPTQKIDLGLTPRDVAPSPINPPTDAPVLEVVSVSGRSMKIKLRAAGSDGRGKPEGVAGASVFSLVADEPTLDITKWTFMGSITRTTFDVEFPASVEPGSRVFLCAFWFSPRSQSGPACDPVGAYLGGGMAAAA